MTARVLTAVVRAAAVQGVLFILALFLCVLLPFTALAQSTQGAASVASSRPFAILDNSFLVEEAFNQEAGIERRRGDGITIWGTRDEKSVVIVRAPSAQPGKDLSSRTNWVTSSTAM